LNFAILSAPTVCKSDPLRAVFITSIAGCFAATEIVFLQVFEVIFAPPELPPPHHEEDEEPEPTLQVIGYVPADG
jgi:hypothetical protein